MLLAHSQHDIGVQDFLRRSITNESTVVYEYSPLLHRHLCFTERHIICTYMDFLKALSKECICLKLPFSIEDQAPIAQNRFQYQLGTVLILAFLQLAADQSLKTL